MTQYLQPKDALIEEMKVNSVLNNRVIYLWDDVSDESCFKLNYYLDRFYRLDKQTGKKEPITIMTHSFGGSIYAGLSCISRIERMVEEGYEIISIVDGVAMSMGSAISQVCSKRKAYRHATFLYHQPSSWAVGTLSEMKISVEETDRLWSKMIDITLEHTFITKDMMDEMHKTNKDVYYSAEQALELGIVDEIL